MKLNDSDAVLVIDKEGKIRMHIPDQSNDEFATSNAVVITLIGALIARNDKEFITLLEKRKNEWLK